MSEPRASSFQLQRLVDPEIKAARIRELNDQFRKTLIGGNATMTSGIAALGETMVAQIIEAVSNAAEMARPKVPQDAVPTTGSVVLASRC